MLLRTAYTSRVPDLPSFFFMGSVLLIFIVFSVVFVFCFVFILCLVCPMLSVSLESQFLIASLSCNIRSAGICWVCFFFQDDSLYIGTDYLVRQIKIINCEQYRWIDSCVKDPHCAWINNESLLKYTSVDMEIQCYNRCRSLTFVRENGLAYV